MNDKHYKSFQDYGREAQRKEPAPQEQNFAQLINWISEVKNSITKLTTDLADYRLQQARQLMDHRDVVSNMMKDRKSIEETMTMILTHLTTPGAVTVQGAVMPAEDAIAFKVAELLKRPIILQKALELSQNNQQPAEQQVTEREQSGQNTPESTEITPNGNIPRKRIKGLEDKMIEVMRDNKAHTANTIYTALSIKYPDLDFHKPSIATGLSLMLKADKVKRLDRGSYQLTIWGSTS